MHMEEASPQGIEQGAVRPKTLEQSASASRGAAHWDKFLDTPVAQEAIKRELDAMGISPERAQGDRSFCLKDRSRHLLRVRA